MVRYFDLVRQALCHPCGFFGGRYAAPWPELLAEKAGFQVVNDGVHFTEEGHARFAKGLASWLEVTL